MTFMKWLKKQVDRDDPIGDLAKDAMRDKRHKPKSRRGWERFLSDVGACYAARDAAKQAWDEYESIN